MTYGSGDASLDLCSLKNFYREAYLYASYEDDRLFFSMSSVCMNSLSSLGVYFCYI